MGIYTERKTGAWFVAAVLAGAFAALYGVWLFVGPELMSSEVIYAAAASELSPKKPLVMTIHGWATPECMPLLPVAARLLRGLTGAPMESVLRGWSILMLAAGSVLVCLAAGSRTSARAGVVAAAMYFSCFLSLGTAVEGTHATGSAFFLAAAQLVFFYYAVRRSDWNRAWIFSALLATLGFLSGGFVVLLFFVLPMFFFRRPLSVSSKFRRPGFAAAVAIVLLAALAWCGAFSSAERPIPVYDMWWRQLSEAGLEWRMLTFPFGVIFWLLPWSLIAWLPFCEAMRSTDKTPIYSRYLRTLALTSLGLLWLLPETGRFGLFYALAPLSVLTGRFYELGMRRYGVKLRRLFVVVEAFMGAAVLVIAAGCFLPSEWLARLFSVEHTLGFRRWTLFQLAIPAVLAASALLAYYVHRKRNDDPAWMILLAASVTSALFFNGLMFPYKSQDRRKREFGSQLREALRREQPDCKLIYSRNVRNLNGGLFYSGVRVSRLDEKEKFQVEEKTVYLLSKENPGTFPQFSGFSRWENVETFEYNGHDLSLWRGTRPETAPDEKNKPNGKTEIKPGVK